MLVLATAFTGVLGFGLQYLIEKVLFAKVLGQPQGEIEDLFKSLPLISGALVAAGLLILLGGYFEPRASGRPRLATSGVLGAILYVAVPRMLTEIESNLTAAEISEQLNQLANSSRADSGVSTPLRPRSLARQQRQNSSR